MGPEPEDERKQEQMREAFIESMKARLEQAQARGQSREQIQELTTAYASEVIRRQIPRFVYQTRSWWVGFRRLLIVSSLAFGLAIGLALFVEHHYASPLCERHAAQQGVAYRGIDYPVIGSSSSTTSTSGSCIFFDSTGQRETVSLGSLEPNAAIALLVSFALQIEFTTPVAFILIALIAASLLKIK